MIYPWWSQLTSAGEYIRNYRWISGKIESKDSKKLLETKITEKILLHIPLL